MSTPCSGITRATITSSSSSVQPARTILPSGCTAILAAPSEAPKSTVTGSRRLPEKVGSGEPSAVSRMTKASSPLGGVKMLPVAQDPASRILPFASSAMSLSETLRSNRSMPDPSLPPGENRESRTPPAVRRATVPYRLTRSVERGGGNQDPAVALNHHGARGIRRPRQALAGHDGRATGPEALVDGPVGVQPRDRDLVQPSGQVDVRRPGEDDLAVGLYGHVVDLAGLSVRGEGQLPVAVEARVEITRGGRGRARGSADESAHQSDEEAAANQQLFSLSLPEQLSLPLPPLSLSLPAPPASLSLPTPPDRLSLPAPPDILSLPAWP